MKKDAKILADHICMTQRTPKAYVHGQIETFKSLRKHFWEYIEYYKYYDDLINFYTEVLKECRN